MRLLVLIFAIILTGQVSAQMTLPQRIRISSGHCGSPCGYEKGFYDIIYDRQLEYNLTDSVFTYRKKTDRKFKKLDVKPSVSFTNIKTYASLDSLFQNFTEFTVSPGKYSFYRIELIHCTSRFGLPVKTETMDFYITTNPNKLHPQFIETLINEYRNIIYKRPTTTTTTK